MTLRASSRPSARACRALHRGNASSVLVATGKEGGAHASHVVAPEEQLLAAPEGVDLETLACLPYSFTTMWLALRSTGLAAANAAGVRVLVNGASGALGRLSLQLLRALGQRGHARSAGAARATDCLALGAVRAVERGPASIASLPSHFHVVLNFGSWDDDPALASRLGRDALGHATTVHPLLANFDRLGWLRGALASRREWRDNPISNRAHGAAGALRAGRCSSPIARRSRCWLRDCASESSRCRWVSARHWRTRARHSRTSPWARPAVRCCCPDDAAFRDRRRTHERHCQHGRRPGCRTPASAYCRTAPTR